MTPQHLALVTGANGHLGFNLVSLLIKQGIPVRASVRSRIPPEPLARLGCETVQADITDKASLVRALQGVHTFYAVGAAFALWARDPQREIYDVNLAGTRNMIEAAAEAGVKRVVYVSSIAALNYSQLPARESGGYNPDRRDHYYNSKNDGEKLAFELAALHGIELVAVLPSAMIGGEQHGRLSVSYHILDLVLRNRIPVETGITLNWIDVKDVAMGCYLAATRGRSGERYILANERCTSIRDTTRVAQELFPQKNISLPRRLPRPLLFIIAWLMELSARVSRKAPLLSVKDIAMFSGLQQDFDTSKARNELGFRPKSADQALRDAMRYLDARTSRAESRILPVVIFLSALLSSVVVNAQVAAPTTEPQRRYLSVETDPAFWVGTVGNGPSFDANIDFRWRSLPRLRSGVLLYSGTWSGAFGKSVLLSDDFSGDDWRTQWRGLGIESQYQFRFGARRGGLQPGLRVQWNQFSYQRDGARLGEANHLVLTPQVGFQWFPFPQLGLYLLPWIGMQVPVAGTGRVVMQGASYQTRKLMPVATVHLGWEFSW